MHQEVEAALLGFFRIRENFTRYSDDVKPNYFSSEYSGRIYEYIEDFFLSNPDRKMVSKRNLKMMLTESGEERKILLELVDLLTGGNPNDDFLNKKVGEFIKDGIVRQAIKDNYAALEGRKAFDIESLYDGLQRARDYNVAGSTLYDYTAETDSLHRTFADEADSVPTGIEGLDNFLTPPPCFGEEWIIVGPPGRGKTQTLLNLVANAASEGYHALYITCGDQGRMRVQSRIDTIASGLSWKQLTDPTKRALGLLRKRIRENIISKGGKIYIQDWADTSATPLQVEALIRSLPKVDLVAIDYPDIMRASTRYHERRHEIASIFADLRRIAVKHGVLIWAGSQANRNALNKHKVTMADVAEDIQKCWVADGIITLCQTEEEKEEDMARFFIAKARRPPQREYEIKILLDPDTGRME